MNPTTKLFIYYDGQCPICGRLARYYQALAPADQIRWLDAHQHQEALAGLLPEQAVVSCAMTNKKNCLNLDALYLRDEAWPAGRFARGAEAVILLWGALPQRHYRILARLATFPGMYPLLATGYRLVAGNRHRLSRLFG